MQPKRHVRMNPLLAPPSVAELQTVLFEADHTKGSTIEQPWRSLSTKKSYSLTVRAELAGGEPIWTLYEGEGANSQILWSSPFRDLELLHDVISLTLPEDAQSKKAEGEKKTSKNGSSPEPAEPRAGGQPAKQPQASPAASNQTPAPSVQPQPSNAPSAQPPYPYPAPAAPPPGYYPPGYMPAPYGYPMPYPGYAPPPMPIGPNGQPVYPPNYYPGYPYAPGYLPYPYGGAPAAPPPGGTYPDSLGTATTVPIKPGVPPAAPGDLAPIPSLRPDPELLKKASNILLGHFLVESGLIPERTLLAALRLQELVKRGFLSSAQAAEAVRRSHERGGEGDPDWEKLKTDMTKVEINAIGPPLGQLLVEAGLISSIVLKAALKLQEVVRSGAMSKEDACKTLYGEYFGTTRAGKVQETDDDSPQVNRVVRLLIKAGIINDQDVIRAKNVRQKHGGKVSKILIATGKVDQQTFDAATECEILVAAEKIKIEKAMIALHYCQRSRVSFKEAVKELGWDKG